ncbi:suppressor of fused domain protein [Jatrophihabitans telluris]|uniref:Suppressor of fused domain protein n=1 Tax=Jatrophihabitans telluris TaxID=2038343 RepID=A0ABY4R3M5_9ACTN|nr:suppressor of fused domain protein [Jatrophihabitans telluris]UQX89700.1 suppressor of fused domain protein [Jatrophihabitans telluris]
MPDDGGGVLAVVEAAYRQHFEVAPSRASVSFVGVEPIEILRYSEGDSDHYVSLGMARFPMADPSESIVDERTAPRAELHLIARGRPDRLWRNLAVLAAAPAVEGAVFSAGGRVDLGEPLATSSRCTGFVLVESTLGSVRYPGVADVQFLQAIPATANELAWSRIHSVEALLARWESASVDLEEIFRDAVPLDG